MMDGVIAQEDTIRRQEDTGLIQGKESFENYSGEIDANTESVTNEEEKIRLVDGLLSPMWLRGSASNIATHSMVTRYILRNVLPGTRVFGLQVRSLDKESKSDSGITNVYDYEVLLSPPCGSLTDCDTRKWRELANRTICINASRFGVCVVPLGCEKLTMAQVSERLFCYLEILEQDALDRGDQVQWFGEFPLREIRRRERDPACLLLA